MARSQAGTNMSSDVVEALIRRIDELEGRLKDLKKPESILKSAKKGPKPSKATAPKMIRFSDTSEGESFVQDSSTSDSDCELLPSNSSSTSKAATRDRNNPSRPIFVQATAFNELNSKEDDAIEWFRKFERAARVNGWSDAEMANNAVLHFEGEALDIWDSMGTDIQSNYESMKKMMIKKMKKMGSETSLTKQFLSLKQQTGETASQLATRMKTLITSSSRLQRESKSSVCKQFVAALRPEISVVLINSSYKDLESLIRSAEKVEAQLNKAEQYAVHFVNATHVPYYTPMPRGYVWDAQGPFAYAGPQSGRSMVAGTPSNQEVPEQYEYGQEPYPISVSASQEFNSRREKQQSSQAYRVGFKGAQNDQTKCYKCQQEGHFARECPEVNSKKPSPDPDKFCEFCFGKGHDEEGCFTKQRIKQRKNESTAGRGSPRANQESSNRAVSM